MGQWATEDEVTLHVSTARVRRLSQMQDVPLRQGDIFPWFFSKPLCLFIPDIQVANYENYKITVATEENRCGGVLTKRGEFLLTPRSSYVPMGHKIHFLAVRPARKSWLQAVTSFAKSV